VFSTPFVYLIHRAYRLPAIRDGNTKQRLSLILTGHSKKRDGCKSIDLLRNQVLNPVFDRMGVCRNKLRFCTPSTTHVCTHTCSRRGHLQYRTKSCVSTCIYTYVNTVAVCVVCCICRSRPNQSKLNQKLNQN
jgi:hypothetical protein